MQGFLGRFDKTIAQRRSYNKLINKYQLIETFSPSPNKKFFLLKFHITKYRQKILSTSCF
jgi:hypothetical protein